MSQKTRNLLISAIAVVVAAAAFIVVRTSGSDDEPTAAAPIVKTAVLSETTSADLRSVMVENKDGGVHFYSPDGAAWQVADVPEFYMLDTTGAVTAVRYFSRVQGQEIEVDADAARLAEFGLDNPEATVTLRDKDGISTVLEFGFNSPTGAGRFARNAESNTIALIPAHISRAALATPDDFRNMSLPVVNLQMMVGFAYRSGETDFIAEPRTYENPYIPGAGPFEIVSPYRGRYEMDDYSLSKLLTETAPLPVMVRSWVDDADPADPAFGLDEENADLINIVDAEGGALSMRVGAEDGNGNRYAMLTDREGAVFLLNRQDLRLLDTRPFDLLNKFLFLANINQVSGVRVEKDGESWTLTRNGQGSESDATDDKYYVNDLPMAHEDINNTYQKFIGLMWEGEISERKTLEYPEVRITVSHELPGVENETIRFWAYDDIYYQATVGDNPLEFLIGRYQVEDFIEELAALSEFAS